MKEQKCCLYQKILDCCFIYGKIRLNVIFTSLKFLFCIGLTFYSIASIANTFAPSSITQANEFRSRLQKVIDHDKAKYNLPALSVSIHCLSSKKILNITSGTKTIRSSEPIDANTLFQMGSITKTYMAVLTLLLESKGRLQLSDTIDKWLPQYSKWKNITIAELLNHSSGIYEVDDTNKFWNGIVRSPQRHYHLSELTDFAYHYQNNFPAGKGYHYTNTDYLLLGMIIEKATHRSVSTNLHREILDVEKFHLTHTFYFSSLYPKSILNQMAHGYNENGIFPKHTDITSVNASYMASDGALIATPDDVATFVQELFSGEILPEKQLQEMLTLISPKSGEPVHPEEIQATMRKQTNEFADIGIGKGIGLVYFKKYGLVWMHAGGTLGYESMYALNPCDNIIVSLAYSARKNQSFIFMRILQDIYSAMGHQKIRKTAPHQNLYDACTTRIIYPSRIF